jgi:hypothetical protein
MWNNAFYAPNILFMQKYTSIYLFIYLLSIIIKLFAPMQRQRIFCPSMNAEIQDYCTRELEIGWRGAQHMNTGNTD